jgi:hypothetical protein
LIAHGATRKTTLSPPFVLTGATTLGRTFGCGFFVSGTLMSEILDLPVALASAPFEAPGKTVAEVVREVSRALYRTEIEPEYVSIANFIDDANEAHYGLLGASAWPEVYGSRRARLTLSVERGHSEGWMIQVDHVCLVEEGDTNHWRSLPVMRIKTLGRTQAWAVAAVVSRLLDID